MKVIIFLLFLFSAAYLSGIETDQSLTEWNQTRLGIQKNGMIVLGTWAAANITVSAVQLKKTRGQTRYFYQMNLFWNIINLGIASAGFVSSLTGSPALNPDETANQYRNLTKILLINAGLDIGYMGIGVFLIQRGKISEKRPERLSGYGYSLLLQGAFLFIFDTALAIINNSSLQDFLTS